MSTETAVDLVVIGLGPGGEHLAAEAAKAGLNVVGIDERLVGGECPYYGCIPSKMAIRAANLLADARRVGTLAGSAQVTPDWGLVHARIRDEATDDWDDTVAVERLEQAGVRFVRGHGRLVDTGVVEVNGTRYVASRGVVLNTGTSPAAPPVDGLADTPFWTNRDVLATPDLPASMVIIGGGAIGGTLGAHLVRAGHDVLLCDADAAHVAAIREHGLRIEGPVHEFTVEIPAVPPDGLPDRIERAVVAVKSLHTRAAAELLRDRLAPDGYVLTVQNGLTADTLVAAVGRERVISSFVNFGADLMAPGVILQGNVATFRVGELDGGTITPRVRGLAELLPYAEPTGNVLGYLWGKEAYGAMLWAGAVSDLSIAETLERPEYRPVMIAIAQEVLDQAPVRVESFDGFVPDDLEGSLDRLAAFNRRSAKTHSGIYRDLAVRKRKTEIDEMLRDVSGPIFDKVAELIHDIEQGRRVNEAANLDELATFVAARSAA